MPFAEPSSEDSAVKFIREAHMLPVWRRAAHQVLPGGRWKTFTEVPATRGVIDVLHCRFRDGELAARRRLGQQPVPDLLSLLVLQHAGGRFTAAGAARTLGVTAGHLARVVLPGLAAAHWLSRDGSTWVRLRRYAVPATELVAVELKRIDWRVALQQAACHAPAVDTSWVVLDEVAERRALTGTAAFEHAGVGLVLLRAISGDGRHCALQIGDVAIPASGGSLTRDDGARALLAEQCLQLLANGIDGYPQSPVFGRDLEAEAVALA